MKSIDTFPGAVDTLARTIWGEARGCGSDGMSHVANVIMNRANHPGWWGDDVISVCRAHEQFSCWDSDDPNYPKLLGVTSSDPQFAAAEQIALKAASRTLPDATGGADSYYALSMSNPPYWEARAVHTFKDTCHQFLRVQLPAPNGGPDAPNISKERANASGTKYAVGTTPSAEERDDLPPKTTTPMTQGTAAGSVGGAAAFSTIVIWVLSMYNINVPNEVAASMIVLATLAAHVIVAFFPIPTKQQ